MTLEGTNTFVVGERPVYVIDPGPADDGHIAAIHAEADRRGGIKGVVLTHSHLDHSEGVDALGAPVLAGERAGPFETIPTPGHAARPRLPAARRRPLQRRPDPRRGLELRAAGRRIAGRLPRVAAPRRRARSRADLSRPRALDHRSRRPRSPSTSTIASTASESSSAALEGGERSRAALLDAAWDDVPPSCGRRRRRSCRPTSRSSRARGGCRATSWTRFSSHGSPANLGKARAAAARRGSGGALGRGRGRRRGRTRRIGRRGPAPPVPAPSAAPLRGPAPRRGAFRAAVEIRRDRWGVPHIRAETVEDLWFAEGYCHGQDRLWQMELYRLSSSGRISEIAGEEGLPSDRLMRTLGLRRGGRARGGGARAGPALPARRPLRRCQRGRRRGAAAAGGVPGPAARLRPVAARWTC